VRRPRHDYLGLLPLADAAHAYCAAWGHPEQASFLTPLLQQAAAGEFPGLRVFVLDGVLYTSTRWVEHFMASAPQATPPQEGEASGLPAPAPLEDAEEQGQAPAATEEPDDEEEPGLFDVDVPLGLDDDEEGPLALDTEDWDRLDPDEELQLVGGVLGVYSFGVAHVPPSGDPVEQDAAFLAFLAAHHPGLFWLHEGLVREGPLRGIPDTPAMLAREAGVSPSTISRCRRRARELYAAAKAQEARRDGHARRRAQAEQRILDAIRDLAALYGHPPSVREVQRYIGVASPHAIHKILVRLKAQGRVRISAHGHGLEVVGTTPEADTEQWP
jgi:hypothetical protein